jgi:hypothetical protein
MAFLMQLVGFSLFLKIAWGVWLIACYALIVWRRRSLTVQPLRPAIVRPKRVEATKTSKRRWRLRANTEAPVLQQSSSLLGLQ